MSAPTTVFVTAGPPLPADRGARVRDLALITRLARERPASLLAIVSSAAEARGLEPLRGSLSLETAVVSERLRPPVRLRDSGPRVPLAATPFLDAGAVTAFTGIVERERPDLVQIEHWFLAPLVQALRPESRPATVASLHNVASAQYRAMARGAAPARRPAYRLKARLALGVERRMLERFDAVACVSEPERELVSALAPGARVEVVPNGVDCASMQPLAEEGDTGVVLFVANFEYLPNLDAAGWLCRSVLPHVRRAHPDARVRLVGPGDGRAAKLGRLSGVELVGPVDDLRPCYRVAQVAVAPLLAGGGTRLKVLEAMARGRPVVATSIGCEGLGVTPGEQALVADRPAEFAGAIVRLLDSREERRALAVAGRELVEREYDWDRSAVALKRAHDRALARARAQGRNRRAAAA